MAFLPGWDRARLRTADPADVEAARWLVFGQAVRPVVERDIEGELEQLKVAELDAKGAERYRRNQRPRQRESLQRALRQQAELRKVLELDDEPEGAGG